MGLAPSHPHGHGVGGGDGSRGRQPLRLDWTGARIARGSRAEHAALPHCEVSWAIKAVRASNERLVVELAFEIPVLTAARSGEVRTAACTEID